jgi:hypothetical protein
MAKIASTNDISYTILVLSTQEQVDTAIKLSKIYDCIYGFSNDGIFWHPSQEYFIYDHWSAPITESFVHEDTDFVILKCSPGGAVNEIMREIHNAREYAVLTYDTWQTTAGLVALVTGTYPEY